MWWSILTGAPTVRSLNGSRAVALDGSSSEILLFDITNDVPQVLLQNIQGNHSGSPRTNFSQSELTFFLSDVDIYEDEGSYTVTASNPAGESEATVFLDVQSGWS